MENELSAAQNAAYDYRRCARVWQRVDPTLDPYPDVRAADSSFSIDRSLLVFLSYPMRGGLVTFH